MAGTRNKHARVTGNPGRPPQQTSHQVSHAELQSLPNLGLSRHGEEAQRAGTTHHLPEQLHSTKNVSSETENAHAHHSQVLTWLGTIGHDSFPFLTLPRILHRAPGTEVPGKEKGTTGSPCSPATWYPMISPLQEGSAIHLRDSLSGSSHSFSSLSGTGSTEDGSHRRPVTICSPQRLHVPQKQKQQQGGEEGELWRGRALFQGHGQTLRQSPTGFELPLIPAPPVQRADG